MAAINEIPRVLITLGGNIRYFRKQKGWTQQELADRVGIVRSAITNIETGTASIALETLYYVAYALGVSVHELLPASYEPDEQQKPRTVKQAIDERLEQFGKRE